MKNHLIIEGKKYISSREASELTGYASDYVGQLSRSGKIDARLVGRTWYVNEESILSYKNLGLEEASKFRPSPHREPANYRFFKILGKSALVTMLLLVCIGTGAYTFSFEYPEIGRIAEKMRIESIDFAENAIDRLLPFAQEVAGGAAYISEDVTQQTASILSSITQGIADATLSFKNAVRNFLGIGDSQVVSAPEKTPAVSTSTSIIKNTITKVIEKPTYISAGVEQSYVDAHVTALRDEIEGLRSFESQQTDVIYRSIGNSSLNSSVNMGFSDLNSFTTTNLAEGSNLYFTDSRVLGTLSSATSTTFGGNVTATAFYGDGSNLTGLTSFSTSTTRGAFSSSATGLNYSTSTGDFSLASGYAIPLTASTTNWNSFYDTPSTRIGTDSHLSWSGNTLTISTSSLGLTTSDIAEGSNLYYTPSRFDSRLAATTSLPNITALANLASIGTITSGVWNGTAIGDAYLTKSGNWTGTFDGQEGTYYLDRANHTGTQLSSTISDFSTTARGLISSSATGLTYTSGTGAFSLTSGYNIPSTASTTEWANKVSSQWTTSGSDIYYNTGNVGIGTTSPSAKLSVAGASGSTANIFTVASSTNSPFFTVTSAGNVGIGRSDPSYPFEVASTNGNPNIAVTSWNTAGASGATLLLGRSRSSAIGTQGNVTAGDRLGSLNFGGTSANVNFEIAGQIASEADVITSGHTLGRLVFSTAATGGTLTERMRIDSSGNIGIGTTTPGSKVDIWGNLNVGTSSTPTLFANTGNGFVGIGTNTPTNKLAIVGGNLSINNTTGNYAQFQLAGISGGSVTLNYIGGAGNIINGSVPHDVVLRLDNGSKKFYISNGANPMFTIDGSNGNLGIGSTTPSSKLTVSGSTFLGGNVTATGTLALTGLSLSTTGNYLCIDTTTNQITSGTTCTLSSNRFKQNIQDLNLGLTTVLALRPVTFSFKQGYGDNGETDQLGFVAEEADSIDPRLVPHDKSGLPSGFNYANYTAVLTKAIQEQQVQINTLKNATTTATTIVQEVSATTTATIIEQSPSFIEKIAASVKNLIASAGDFIVSTVRATLAVFDRVEVKTAAVSEGLEMKDQATGAIYCVVIKNGEWDKKQGTCAEVAVVTSTAAISTSTPSIITSTPETTTPVASSTPSISATSTPDVATSTPAIEPVIIPTPDPTPTPEPAPTPAPAPEQTTTPEPAPISVDNTQ